MYLCAYVLKLYLCAPIYLCAYVLNPNLRSRSPYIFLMPSKSDV